MEEGLASTADGQGAEEEVSSHLSAHSGQGVLRASSGSEVGGDDLSGKGKCKDSVSSWFQAFLPSLCGCRRGACSCGGI